MKTLNHQNTSRKRQNCSGLSSYGSKCFLPCLLLLLCLAELKFVHTWHFYNSVEGGGRALASVMTSHLDQLPSMNLGGQSQLLIPVGSHQLHSHHHRQIIRDISEQPKAAQQASPAITSSTGGSNFMSEIMSAASNAAPATLRDDYLMSKDQAANDVQEQFKPSSAASNGVNNEFIYSHQVSSSSSGASSSNSRPPEAAESAPAEVPSAGVSDYPAQTSAGQAAAAASTGISSALPALGKILEVASSAVVDRAISSNSSLQQSLNSSTLAASTTEKLANVALQMLKPRKPEQRGKQQLVNTEQQIINQHARLHLTGHSHQRLLPTKQRDNKLANTFFSSPEGSSGSSDGRNSPLNSLFGNLKSGITSRSSIVKAAISDNKLARTLSTLGKSITGNKYVAGAAAASAIAALGLTMSKFLSPYFFAGGFSKLGEGSMMGSGSFVNPTYANPNRANTFSTFSPSALEDSSLLDQISSSASSPSYTGAFDSTFTPLDNVATSGSSNLYHFLQPQNTGSSSDDLLYLKYKAKSPLSSYSDTNGHFADYYQNIGTGATSRFSTSSAFSQPSPSYSSNLNAANFSPNNSPFSVYSGENTAASNLEPQFASATSTGNSYTFPATKFKAEWRGSNQHSTLPSSTSDLISSSPYHDTFLAQPSTSSVRHSAPAGSTAHRSGAVALKLDEESRARLSQLLREQQLLLNQRLREETPSYEYSSLSQPMYPTMQAFSLPIAGSQGESMPAASSADLPVSQSSMQLEFQPVHASPKTARMMNGKAFFDTSSHSATDASTPTTTLRTGTHNYAPAISAIPGQVAKSSSSRLATQSVPKTISQPSYFILRPKTAKASQVATLSGNILTPPGEMLDLAQISSSSSSSSSSKPQQATSGLDSARSSTSTPATISPAAPATNRDIKQQRLSVTSQSSGSSWNSLNSMDSQSSISQKQQTRPSATNSKQTNNNNNNSNLSNNANNDSALVKLDADQQASSQSDDQQVSTKAPLSSSSIVETPRQSLSSDATGNTSGNTTGSKVLLLKRNSRTPADGASATVKIMSLSGVVRQSSLPQAVKVVTNQQPEQKNVSIAAASLKE